MHRKGLRWGIWAAVCAIVYYAFYPPFNIQSTGMWIYLACMAVLWVILAGPEGKKTIVHHIHKGKRSYRKSSEIPVRIYLITVIAAVFSIAWALSALILSPLFLSGTYAARITVTNEDFSSVPAYSFNHTAIIDRDSAENLGDKVMGEMSDLVSQFEVSSEYSQISWQDGTYRVTPLAYQSFIKYLRNRKDGIPGYILVNTTTGSAACSGWKIRCAMYPVPGSMIICTGVCASAIPQHYLADRHLRLMMTADHGMSAQPTGIPVCMR